MKRILIIEDNVDSVEMLTMLVELQGCSVSSARLGGEGILLARTFQPDLIITDLGLPDMNGLDVIRSLGDVPGPQNRAIVVLTGEGDFDTRRQAESAGATRVFVKGDEVGKLLHFIDQHVV